MAVPYTFGSATSAIPLSQLDSNFNTTITLGNTAIQLGNTVTTLNNMTFANVTISSVSTPITVAQGGTGTSTAFTAGSVVFAGASGVYSQNNANLFWDNTNKFLGIGTNAPGYTVDARSSQASATNWSASVNTSATSPTAGFIAYLPNVTGTPYSTFEMRSTGDLVISNTGVSGAGNITFVNTGSTRATIDSSGNLLVGTTSAGGGSGNQFRCWSATAGKPAADLYINAASSTATAALVVNKYDNNTTTSQVFVQFSVNQYAAGSGQINANGANAAAFGSYSDKRLKENIESLPPQLANICALRPVEFDYKAGGHQIGFIAQEMQQVYPDVVGEGDDGMLTITGWSKTEARLVAAIQELHAKVQALESQLAAKG